MHINEIKVTNSSKNNNSSKINTQPTKSSNNNSTTSSKNRQDSDANPASNMSNLSSYSLIDDDHIDMEETINVGNLIIDLESDLEKEKIENEQANAKPSTSTNSPALSSTSSFVSKTSTSNSNLTTTGGKSHTKTVNKNSIMTVNNATTSSSSTSINVASANNGASNNGASNNGLVMSTRTVFKSSADERGELKMRITRETKPGKSEHKIVISPNQKSPTSSSNSSSKDNQATISQLNECDDNSINETSKPAQSSSISSTKECGTSTSIGTITEPDCLGPCEPGTSVTLEGIVWQETEGGILVVNVTWRGKTYVGALLDCTKHDWAPPRLCDSPASDVDSKAHKGVRAKRIVTRSNCVGLDEKNLLQTTGKLRNGKGRRILNSTDLAPCNKRAREADKSSNENIPAQIEVQNSATNVSSITDSETTNTPMNVDATSSTFVESITTSNVSSKTNQGPKSPTLISCSEPNCSKKYRNLNGLLYHQSYAHGADNESNNAHEEGSSPSPSPIKEACKTSEEADSVEVNRSKANPDSDNSIATRLADQKQEVNTKSPPKREERTPSPHLTPKMSIKTLSDNVLSNICGPSFEQEQKLVDHTRRGLPMSLGHNQGPPFIEQNLRSPGASRHLTDMGQSSNSMTSSKSNSSTSKQSIAAPLPATTEEGMKPSGTSTGPPPAPHQANCYFNSGFLASAFNPFGMPPYFPRTQVPVYDPLGPPQNNPANNALLSRFVNMRLPTPPDSSSRLLSPSVSKSMPFSHYKVDPGSIVNPQLPNMHPMPNPPMASGSPLLRMPSQGDSMLPPTSQPPPFPIPGVMNTSLGMPGPPGNLFHPNRPPMHDHPNL